MQIQGTGEIGSTKQKFHLSGVPLIESRLYYQITLDLFTFKETTATFTFNFMIPSVRFRTRFDNELVKNSAI